MPGTSGRKKTQAVSRVRLGLPMVWSPSAQVAPVPVAVSCPNTLGLRMLERCRTV